MASPTPMEDIMRTKLTTALSPTHLEIHNDSHLHAHHAAMASSTSSETHFRVVITAGAFRGQRQPARHRLVYGLLRDEMARQGGIHALQLRTRTPEEAGEGRGEDAGGEKEAASGLGSGPGGKSDGVEDGSER